MKRDHDHLDGRRAAETATQERGDPAPVEVLRNAARVPERGHRRLGRFLRRPLADTDASPPVGDPRIYIAFHV